MAKDNFTMMLYDDGMYIYVGHVSWFRRLCWRVLLGVKFKKNDI